MCLIIHKPAGTPIPATLVEAAVRFNSDGWGAMGFTASGRTIITRWKTDTGERHPTVRRHANRR